ncbi:MAG: hypothetical protein HYU28_05655 [Actinobacteria bacterium]|nr:hypothetical protein [Actinomycetota bacterium]
MKGSSWAAVMAAVLRHPSLWATAFTQIFRCARRGWWRRPPFLPRPDQDYLRFRLQTAYGGDPPPGALRPDDVVTYLRWCREYPR